MNNIKKIVLFGPESTGKTTLAKNLALKYNTLWCPEFTRDYLALKNKIEQRQSKGIVSVYADIEPIAIGQLSWEEAFCAQANRLLFYDTNLLTNLIYSYYYFEKAPKWLEETLKNRTYDLYLLLNTDIAWEQDPFRDRPEARQEIYQLFANTLLERGEKFIPISGLGEERLHNAIKIIENAIEF